MANNIFASNFKKVFTIALTATLVVSGFFVINASAIGVDGWTMFNNDLLNTGVVDPGLSGISIPAELWSYSTDNTTGPGSP